MRECPNCHAQDTLEIVDDYVVCSECQWEFNKEILEEEEWEKI